MPPKNTSSVNTTNSGTSSTGTTINRDMTTHQIALRTITANFMSSISPIDANAKLSSTVDTQPVSIPVQLMGLMKILNELDIENDHVFEPAISNRLNWQVDILTVALLTKQPAVFIEKLLIVLKKQLRRLEERYGGPEAFWGLLPTNGKSYDHAATLFVFLFNTNTRRLVLHSVLIHYPSLVPLAMSVVYRNTAVLMGDLKSIHNFSQVPYNSHHFFLTSSSRLTRFPVLGYFDTSFYHLDRLITQATLSFNESYHAFACNQNESNLYWKFLSTDSYDALTGAAFEQVENQHFNVRMKNGKVTKMSFLRFIAWRQLVLKTEQPQQGYLRDDYSDHWTPGGIIKMLYQPGDVLEGFCHGDVEHQLLGAAEQLLIQEEKDNNKDKKDQKDQKDHKVTDDEKTIIRQPKPYKQDYPSYHPTPPVSLGPNYLNKPNIYGEFDLESVGGSKHAILAPKSQKAKDLYFSPASSTSLYSLYTNGLLSFSVKASTFASGYHDGSAAMEVLVDEGLGVPFYNHYNMNPNDLFHQDMNTLKLYPFIFQSQLFEQYQPVSLYTQKNIPMYPLFDLFLDYFEQFYSHLSLSQTSYKNLQGNHLQQYPETLFNHLIKEAVDSGYGYDATNTSVSTSGLTQKEKYTGMMFRLTDKIRMVQVTEPQIVPLIFDSDTKLPLNPIHKRYVEDMNDHATKRIRKINRYFQEEHNDIAKYTLKQIPTHYIEDLHVVEVIKWIRDNVMNKIDYDEGLNGSHMIIIITFLISMLPPTDEYLLPYFATHMPYFYHQNDDINGINDNYAYMEEENDGFVDQVEVDIDDPYVDHVLSQQQKEQREEKKLLEQQQKQEKKHQQQEQLFTTTSSTTQFNHQISSTALWDLLPANEWTELLPSIDGVTAIFYQLMSDMIAYPTLFKQSPKSLYLSISNKHGLYNNHFNDFSHGDVDHTDRTIGIINNALKKSKDLREEEMKKSLLTPDQLQFYQVTYPRDQYQYQHVKQPYNYVTTSQNGLDDNNNYQQDQQDQQEGNCYDNSSHPQNDISTRENNYSLLTYLLTHHNLDNPDLFYQLFLNTQQFELTQPLSFINAQQEINLKGLYTNPSNQIVHRFDDLLTTSPYQHPKKHNTILDPYSPTRTPYHSTRDSIKHLQNTIIFTNNSLNSRKKNSLMNGTIPKRFSNRQSLLLTLLISRHYSRSILEIFLTLGDAIDWDYVDDYGLTVLDYCIIFNTFSYAPQFVLAVIEKTNFSLINTPLLLSKLGVSDEKDDITTSNPNDFVDLLFHDDQTKEKTKENGQSQQSNSILVRRWGKGKKLGGDQPQPVSERDNNTNEQIHSDNNNVVDQSNQYILTKSTLIQTTKSLQASFKLLWPLLSFYIKSSRELQGQDIFQYIYLYSYLFKYIAFNPADHELSPILFIALLKKQLITDGYDDIANTIPNWMNNVDNHDDNHHFQDQDQHGDNQTINNNNNNQPTPSLSTLFESNPSLSMLFNSTILPYPLLSLVMRFENVVHQKSNQAWIGILLSHYCPLSFPSDINTNLSYQTSITLIPYVPIQEDDYNQWVEENKVWKKKQKEGEQNQSKDENNENNHNNLQQIITPMTSPSLINSIYSTSPTSSYIMPPYNHIDLLGISMYLDIKTFDEVMPFTYLNAIKNYLFINPHTSHHFSSSLSSPQQFNITSTSKTIETTVFDRIYMIYSCINNNFDPKIVQMLIESIPISYSYYLFYFYRLPPSHQSDYLYLNRSGNGKIGGEGRENIDTIVAHPITSNEIKHHNLFISHNTITNSTHQPSSSLSLTSNPSSNDNYRSIQLGSQDIATALGYIGVLSELKPAIVTSTTRSKAYSYIYNYSSSSKRDITSLYPKVFDKRRMVGFFWNRPLFLSSLHDGSHRTLPNQLYSVSNAMKHKENEFTKALIALVTAQIETLQFLFDVNGDLEEVDVFVRPVGSGGGGDCDIDKGNKNKNKNNKNNNNDTDNIDPNNTVNITNNDTTTTITTTTNTSQYPLFTPNKKKYEHLTFDEKVKHYSGLILIERTAHELVLTHTRAIYSNSIECEYNPARVNPLLDCHGTIVLDRIDEYNPMSSVSDQMDLVVLPLSGVFEVIKAVHQYDKVKDAREEYRNKLQDEKKLRAAEIEKERLKKKEEKKKDKKDKKSDKKDKKSDKKDKKSSSSSSSSKNDKKDNKKDSKEQEDKEDKVDEKKKKEERIVPYDLYDTSLNIFSRGDLEALRYEIYHNLFNQYNDDEVVLKQKMKDVISDCVQQWQYNTVFPELTQIDADLIKKDKNDNKLKMNGNVDNNNTNNNNNDNDNDENQLQSQTMDNLLNPYTISTNLLDIILTKPNYIEYFQLFLKTTPMAHFLPLSPYFSQPSLTLIDPTMTYINHFYSLLTSELITFNNEFNNSRIFHPPSDIIGWKNAIKPTIITPSFEFFDPYFYHSHRHIFSTLPFDLISQSLVSSFHSITKISQYNKKGLVPQLLYPRCFKSDLNLSRVLIQDFPYPTPSSRQTIAKTSNTSNNNTPNINNNHNNNINHTYPLYSSPFLNMPKIVKSFGSPSLNKIPVHGFDGLQAFKHTIRTTSLSAEYPDITGKGNQNRTNKHGYPYHHISDWYRTENYSTTGEVHGFVNRLSDPSLLLLDQYRVIMTPGRHTTYTVQPTAINGAYDRHMSMRSHAITAGFAPSSFIKQSNKNDLLIVNDDTIVKCYGDGGTTGSNDIQTIGDTFQGVIAVPNRVNFHQKAAQLSEPPLINFPINTFLLYDNQGLERSSVGNVIKDRLVEQQKVLRERMEQQRLKQLQEFDRKSRQFERQQQQQQQQQQEGNTNKKLQQQSLTKQSNNNNNSKGKSNDTSAFCSVEGMANDHDNQGFYRY